MSQGSFYSAVQILVLYVSIFHSIDLQVQSQLSWFIDVYICFFALDLINVVSCWAPFLANSNFWRKTY